MNLNTLRIGDLIVREKGPFSTHYIVWIGWRNGVRVVAENHSTQGVRYTSLEVALGGQPIKRFEKFGGNEFQRRLVISRINRMLGRSYDLVVFNCEHFARWISTGRLVSNQVRVAINILLVVGAFMLTNKNSNIRSFGLFLLCIGGMVKFSQR